MSCACTCWRKKSHGITAQNVCYASVAEPWYTQDTSLHTPFWNKWLIDWLIDSWWCWILKWTGHSWHDGPFLFVFSPLWNGSTPPRTQSWGSKTIYPKKGIKSDAVSCQNDRPTLCYTTVCVHTTNDAWQAHTHTHTHTILGLPATTHNSSRLLFFAFWLLLRFLLLLLLLRRHHDLKLVFKTNHSV